VFSLNKEFQSFKLPCGFKNSDEDNNISAARRSIDQSAMANLRIGTNSFGLWLTVSETRPVSIGGDSAGRVECRRPLRRAEVR
jgi:hypothetical protein